MSAPELLCAATKRRFFQHAFHRAEKFALQRKFAPAEILRSLRIQLRLKFAASAERANQKASLKFLNAFQRVENAEAEAVQAERLNLSNHVISVPIFAALQKHPEKFQHGGYGFCLF